jgi:hypothetical protein
MTTDSNGYRLHIDKRADNVISIVEGVRTICFREAKVAKLIGVTTIPTSVLRLLR